MAAVVTAVVISSRVPSPCDQSSVRHAIVIGGGTSQINMMVSIRMRIGQTKSPESSQKRPCRDYTLTRGKSSYRKNRKAGFNGEHVWQHSLEIDSLSDSRAEKA